VQGTSELAPNGHVVGRRGGQLSALDIPRDNRIQRRIQAISPREQIC
jgi:hypothetical protein